MREIKFRGKRISNGKWLYGDLMHDTVDGCYVFPIDCAALYKENAVLPETIGQFTGLKDKNGKEIYEGDIVESIGGNVGYVVFLPQEMGYVVVWNDCDTRLGHRNRGGGYEDDPSIEVVGNIYDNKEKIAKSIL